MNEGGIGLKDEESFAAPNDHWPHFFPNQQGKKYDYDGSEDEFPDKNSSATHASLRTKLLSKPTWKLFRIMTLVAEQNIFLNSSPRISTLIVS